MTTILRCDGCRSKVPETDMHYVLDWTGTLTMHCCIDCAKKYWAYQDAIAEIDEREETE